MNLDDRLMFYRDLNHWFAVMRACDFTHEFVRREYCTFNEAQDMLEKEKEKEPEPNCLYLTIAL